MKAKAAAAPKDSGSKTVPIPLARKTEVPKGPRKPGIPRPRHSKGPVRRQKPRTRGRMERLRFYWSFYSPTNHHSIYFTVTYLTIRNSSPKKKEKKKEPREAG